MATVAYLSERPFPASGTDTEQIVRTISGLCAVGVDIELVAPRNAWDYLASPERRAEQVARYYGVPMPFPLRTLPCLPRPPERSEFHPVDIVVHAAQATSFLPVALGYLALSRPKLVHARTPPSMLAAMVSGRSVVYETYRADADLPRRLLGILRRTAGVVVHSKAAGDALVAAGVPETKVHVLRNGWDPSFMGEPVEPRQARHSLGLATDCFLCVYAGHCRRDKGVDGLLDLALRVPEVRVLVLGAEPENRARLERRAKAERIGNVEVRERVPPAEVARYLYAADVLLIPTPRAHVEGGPTRTLLPIKTYAYMASARPILAPRLPDIEEVLVDGSTALLCAPGDPDAAAARLRELVGSPELRDRLGRAARSEADRHTLRARAKKLRELYAAAIGVGIG